MTASLADPPLASTRYPATKDRRRAACSDLLQPGRHALRRKCASAAVDGQGNIVSHLIHTGWQRARYSGYGPEWPAGCTGSERDGHVSQFSVLMQRLRMG